MSKLTRCFVLLLVTQISCSIAADWDAYQQFYSRMLNNGGQTYSFIVNCIWNGAHRVAAMQYATSNARTHKCLLDIGKFHDGYIRRESWALKMLDSSAQFPSGFLEGNLLDFGNFQECIEVENKTLNITGQSCNVYFVLKGKNLPYISNFFIIENSVCVPDSCSTQDLQDIMTASTSREGFNPVVSTCQSKKTIQTPVGRMEVMIFWTFGVIGAILLSGTGYELILKTFFSNNQETMPLIENSKEIEGNSKLHRAVLAFSLLTNTAELFKTDTSSKSVKCLYGLRFLSACFIVSIHRMLLDPQPFSNIFMFETELRRWYRAFHMNAYLFVDLFFVMSGLLISYKYSNINLRGKFRPVHYYLHRYVRLTPPLAVCILLELMFPMFCDGPFCDSILKAARKRCMQNYIYTLTYINNFVNPSDKCLLHSWYLSADIQLYFLASILILCMRKWPRSFPSLLLLCLAASSLATFGLSYKYDFYAGYLGTGASDYFIKESETVYEPFYTRAGPWIIGFALGIILQSFNRESYRLSKGLLTIGWVTGLVSLLVGYFGVIPFVQVDFNHGMWDYIYKACFRSLFGLGGAWIIYVCYTGHCDCLNKILSLPAFHPLGRVSYCLYLIHPFVIMLQYRSASGPRKYTDFSQASFVIGDICYSIVFAVFLHLAVEAPTLKLERIFLSHSNDNVKTKDEETLEMFKSNGEKRQV